MNVQKSICTSSTHLLVAELKNGRPLLNQATLHYVTAVTYERPEYFSNLHRNILSSNH